MAAVEQQQFGEQHQQRQELLDDWDLLDSSSSRFSFWDELLASQEQEDEEQLPISPPLPPSAPPQRRLNDALLLLRLGNEFLAQVWAPTTSGVLTTQDQPYALIHSGNADLLQYRALSLGYVFPSSNSSSSSDPATLLPGLPGRVFSRIAPEWTPNVQLYDCREYLRVADAARCNVRGAVALPVIDPGCGGGCIGVIELVSTVEKLDYADEVGAICNALRAVNLHSSSDVGRGFLPPHQVLRQGREMVFAEISQVLTVICNAHKLPLAQTWLPCDLMSLSSTGLARLVTRGAPFFVSDERLWGFHQACCEQSLEKGQGVAGRAFVTNQPTFKDDIRKYSVEEYPLVYYARYFKLCAAVGIRLRSVHTGAEDYVIELFLPRDCVDTEQQQNILNTLSITMQCVCHSLRTLTNKEVRDKQRSESEAFVDGPCKKRRGSSEENSGESTSEASAKSAVKKRSSSEKTVALEELQKHFAGSLKDAARKLGVCPTTLKRICRQYGISRWPSRKINKVSRSLLKLQGVIDSVQGVDRGVKLDTLNGELASTAMANANLTRKHAAAAASREVAVTGLRRPNPEPRNNSASAEERVHGGSAALSALGCSSARPSPLGCSSSLDVPLSPRTASGKQVKREEGEEGAEKGAEEGADAVTAPPAAVTIKATLGGDTVRFRLPAGFSYAELRAEVAARFRVEVESVCLRYLDDDEEWVMLSSEEDLEECLDVMRSFGASLVKLSVREDGLSSPSLSSVNR